MQQDAAGDEGFTLMELVVVVIVIGVLASVAIPVYIHQREKGHDAQARADLRNLAQHQELLLHRTGTYGTGAELDIPIGRVTISPGVDLRVVGYTGAEGFCLTSRHESSASTWSYDSLEGGALPKNAPCPTSYATADGTRIR
jgi:type IV pilus assembly protein PilA